MQKKTRDPTDHIDVRILQNMISGIPSRLGPWKEESEILVPILSLSHTILHHTITYHILKYTILVLMWSSGPLKHSNAGLEN